VMEEAVVRSGTEAYEEGDVDRLDQQRDRGDSSLNPSNSGRFYWCAMDWVAFDRIARFRLSTGPDTLPNNTCLIYLC